MSIFYQEEVRADPSKRAKYCFASALKNAFSKCHSSKRNLPYSIPQEPTTDFDQQEEELVSEVMSKYMESKSKRETSNIGINSLCNFLALSMEYIININSDIEDEFASAATHISIPSSADFDDDDDSTFISAKTCFSRCSSSLSNIDFKDMRTRSMILGFIHCEGWPFGLCRKALLLPPLPKSPADSWSWNKSGKIIKIHE